MFHQTTTQPNESTSNMLGYLVGNSAWKQTIDINVRRRVNQTNHSSLSFCYNSNIRMKKWTRNPDQYYIELKIYILLASFVYVQIMRTCVSNRINRYRISVVNLQFYMFDLNMNMPQLINANFIDCNCFYFAKHADESGDKCNAVDIEFLWLKMSFSKCLIRIPYSFELDYGITIITL